jgi:hypothetical protein
MTKKLHIYIIILTLSLFLLPSLTYACGTLLEKKCCKKEMSAKSKPHKCSEKSHAADNNNGCDGKCGHSNCTTTSININFAMFNEFDLAYNIFDFTSEKQNFSTTTTFISAGYSSLWLIPKIS